VLVFVLVVDVLPRIQRAPEHFLSHNAMLVPTEEFPVGGRLNHIETL
jgi:hypothetical protein